MRNSEKGEKDLSRRRKGEDLDYFLSTEIRRRRSQYRILQAVRAPSSKHLTGTALLMLILAGFLAVFSGSHLLNIVSSDLDCALSSSTSSRPTGEHSVALIDQLSLEYPDPAFARAINETARGAGYGFEYYPPETVGMNFFMTLPSHSFSIVILRTHGTGLYATDPAAIVTSEQYSGSQHVADQLTNRVTSVKVNGVLYYGLGPRFISDAMCGRFSGTLVLAMFCAGAGLSDLAKAFIEKGAGAYIGWNGGVTVSHTDLTFESLVKLLLKGTSVGQSVNNATTISGPDPLFGSRLVSYTQNSFSQQDSTLKVTSWWDEYWYLISAGILVSIIVLRKARATQTKLTG